MAKTGSARIRWLKGRTLTCLRDSRRPNLIRYNLNRALFGVALGLVVWGCPADVIAQGVRLEVVEEIQPPRGPGAEAYDQATRSRRVRTQVVYAAELGNGVRDTTPIREADRRPARRGEGGSVGIGLVIVALLAAFGLWLRFGGTGALLAREPKEVQARTVAPQAWKIDASETLGGPDDLIAQLRNMADRSEALVKLLRHALLAAGQANDTRFARADTEREAFARLPDNWRYLEKLAEILRTTELAHYGGRPVTDRAFDEALAAGQIILNAGRSHA